MKVTESFAIEATEEVRKDPRFEWYVNWLKSLENWKEEDFPDLYGKFIYVGIEFSSDNDIVTLRSYCFDEILTLDEVYFRYGKEIYEANGIEQPFQGSREYDEKLLSEYIDYHENKRQGSTNGGWYIKPFLNNRYPNESILKQIAEHKAKIEELKKQLR